MNHKYEILEVHETDNLYQKRLVGKVGVGNLSKHPIYPEYCQGGLDLSFKRKIPSKVLYTTTSGKKTTIDGPDKYTQSTEYIYFDAVKIRKVGN